EVMSLSNVDMLAKVDTYIRYGTRLVLVVYPEQQAVFVYRPEPDDSLNLRKFTPDSVLEGGEVLPGFSVEARRLFPEK
ncbi:MAG: Uma2 family endonuclease, partial [Melioribacteraceae bacterium]|nr:Uma2 family endonuclease [Melioribacteraceae bacterium]